MKRRLLNALPRVLLALLTALIAAGAGPAAPDALGEGLRLYDALEYRAALPHLASARDDQARPTPERARAALYIGVIHLTLGEEDLARASLREALLLDRELTLPDDFSPKVRETVDALRVRLPPAPEHAPPPTETAQGGPVAASAPAAPAPQDTSPPAATAPEVPAPAAAPADEERSILSEWWLWTGAAAAVAVAAAGSAVAVYLIWFHDWGGSDNGNGTEEPCDAPDGEGCLRVRF